MLTEHPKTDLYASFRDKYTRHIIRDKARHIIRDKAQFLIVLLNPAQMYLTPHPYFPTRNRNIPTYKSNFSLISNASKGLHKAF